MELKLFRYEEAGKILQEITDVRVKLEEAMKEANEYAGIIGEPEFTVYVPC